jgi:uncharacterized lipoprotein YddW (UPF0748 family)
MVASSPRFPDVQTHWARQFIEALAQRGILRGFPDGTFRPEQAVSRAEFAVMVQTAFPRVGRRPYQPFVDVPANFWAAKAIRWAYETAFLSGFPDQRFRPNDPIARAQVLVSLVGGLALSSASPPALRDLYEDANQIPDWATGAVAIATTNALAVNVPSLSRLRPTQPATRAEVAAMVYQGLVALQQAPEIASTAIVRVPQTTAVSHPREFRAAWITAVWNKDFPSRSGLPSAQQKAELIQILDQLQATQFNAVIFQVRPEGDALYRSSLEPWSHWLSGTQGQPPAPFYDPLEFAIAQCHQRGMELHAWFNPYRARTARSTVNVPPHLAATNPELVYTWGNQLWMDPGAKRVQDRTYAVIMDVVNRYDLDGVHLDDYFYPYPIAGQTFPDGATYTAYRNQGGQLSLADWRRDNVNQMVQRLRAGIRATKPHVKFGISPFGIYRPGQPPSVRGLDAYDQLYADALKWLQLGWVDYLSPQLYWRIDAPAQSYPALLDWWASNNPQQRHLYIGNNLAQLDGKAWELEEIERQIEITRQHPSQWVLGNIFFSMNSLAANREGVGDRFRNATYQIPALAPQVSWLSAPAAKLPANVQVRNGTLTWAAPTTAPRAWSLYQQFNNNWVLQAILPGASRSIQVQPGTYALAAVNRLAQETAGVVVRA